MTTSIISPDIQAALDKIHRTDRTKARLYYWETNSLQQNRLDEWTWDERKFWWNPDAPLWIDQLQSTADMLCKAANMRPVKVVLKAHDIELADGTSIPSNWAPRYFHEIWIHPDMRQGRCLAHEVAHKVIQDRTRASGSHRNAFQGMLAFLLARLVPTDQVALQERLEASMRRYGLEPI